MTKELVILNRTLERAQKLAEDLLELPECNGKIKAGQLRCKNMEMILRNTNILINATSLGMSPQNEIMPINPEVLHYKPVETRLLREARKKKAKIINGLSMLVHQGAASFRIWTKMRAPIEVMIKATTEKLKKISNMLIRNAIAYCAVTIINAISCGFGKALGIDLFTEVWRFR
jgi:shikimate dehydrogenase